MLIQAERLSLGNIFVVGSLRGIAHAGYYGDSDAVIAASVMNPMQLRISDVAMRAPEEKEDGAEAAECAYINENNHIVVDRLQLLTHLRPNLTKLERELYSCGEAIVITSGKGGVGKTTTSANIGTALALSGKKVCLIDTDIGLRNLDVVMGLENRIVFDLVDVVEGRCRLPQALIKDKRFDDLYLLPAAQTSDKSAVTPEQMDELIQVLRQDYDYILIDCPAGIEQGFKNAVAGADKAIVVTTPEVSSMRDADRIIGLLEKRILNHRNLLLIVCVVICFMNRIC